LGVTIILQIGDTPKISKSQNLVPLNDTEVRTAKILDRRYKLADEGGLYLLVTPMAAAYGASNIGYLAWRSWWHSEVAETRRCKRLGQNEMLQER